MIVKWTNSYKQTPKKITYNKKYRLWTESLSFRARFLWNNLDQCSAAGVLPDGVRCVVEDLKPFSCFKKH